MRQLNNLALNIVCCTVVIDSFRVPRLPHPPGVVLCAPRGATLSGVRCGCGTAVESPQGEVPENFLPNDPQTNDKLPEMNEKGVHKK